MKKPTITTTYFAIEYQGTKIGPFDADQWRELRSEIDRLFLGSPHDDVVQNIIGRVSAWFRVDPRLLLDGSRRAAGKGSRRRQPEHVTWPRQVAMFLIRRTGDYSLEEVGRIFGRNHGTVMHAVDAVTNRFKYERVLNELKPLLDVIVAETGGRRPQLCEVNRAN